MDNGELNKDNGDGPSGQDKMYNDENDDGAIDELDNANFSEKNNGFTNVHLAYCSEQLGKIEMVESDEEDQDMITNLHCLPEDLATTLGSVKRSLLETLEKYELEKKMKHTTSASTSWGANLASRQVTTNHKNVKIMDKATTYM
ncbi:hypothetical protein D1007_26948 [Hordeum vulgare]|nr:hypothetical protein D1007_26948 [Hordeum vulgare]